MKNPSTYTLGALLSLSQSNAVNLCGLWVPARPEGNSSIPNRLRAAWLVFTGRADAVTWPCGQ